MNLRTFQAKKSYVHEQVRTGVLLHERARIPFLRLQGFGEYPLVVEGEWLASVRLLPREP